MRMPSGFTCPENVELVCSRGLPLWHPRHYFAKCMEGTSNHSPLDRDSCFGGLEGRLFSGKRRYISMRSSRRQLVRRATIRPHTFWHQYDTYYSTACHNKDLGKTTSRRSLPTDPAEMVPRVFVFSRTTKYGATHNRP